MISRSIIKNVVTAEAAIYTILGTNPYGMAIFLHNIGANIITFKFQKALENLEDSFTDLDEDVDGFSAINGILDPGGVASTLLVTTSPYIRLLAHASGGSVLHSAVNQFSKSTSDILPILTI